MGHRIYNSNCDIYAKGSKGKRQNEKKKRKRIWMWTIVVSTTWERERVHAHVCMQEWQRWGFVEWMPVHVTNLTQKTACTNDHLYNYYKIIKVCQTAYFELKCIGSICSVSHWTCNQNSCHFLYIYLLSWLDYCNIQFCHPTSLKN